MPHLTDIRCNISRSDTKILTKGRNTKLVATRIQYQTPLTHALVFVQKQLYVRAGQWLGVTCDMQNISGERALHDLNLYHLGWA